MPRAISSSFGASAMELPCSLMCGMLPIPTASPDPAAACVMLGVGLSMRTVIRPCFIAFATIHSILLIGGMFVPAAFVNLAIRAEEVRGAIMPPGMITTRETPADAMRDMAAANPRLVTYAAPPSARGDQLLVPRIVDGVKIYDLDASVIRWNILPDVPVTAYAINHQVPGPRLEFVFASTLQITFQTRPPCTGMG